jgi:hypothetical protein
VQFLPKTEPLDGDMFSVSHPKKRNMMDKTPLLNDIKNALKALLSQTEQIEAQNMPLHAIDKDLLLEKTRRLYEQMQALEFTQRAGQKEPQQKPAPDEDNLLTQDTEEKVQIEAEPASMAQETVEKAPAETVQPPEFQHKPEIIPPETVPEKQPAERNKKEVPSAASAEKPVDPAKTTLDLFSEVPQETVGETLKVSEKPAVADHFQQNGIGDLREAIGINDKFLFVNELFNGDLERYNKVVDELNGFSGLSGAQTYLAELQVQYQWEENSPAHQKLNDLLKRKFV